MAFSYPHLSEDEEEEMKENPQNVEAQNQHGTQGDRGAMQQHGIESHYDGMEDQSKIMIPKIIV